jgi:hypothetical protein
LRLERLTFVHDGDQGTIGKLIFEAKGVLRFTADHSGLLEISPSAGAEDQANLVLPTENSVRITAVAFSSLAPAVREEIGAEQVPCLLGHAGVHTVKLLSSRSIRRVAPSLSDLRGKVRFALARVGWDL